MELHVLLLFENYVLHTLYISKIYNKPTYIGGTKEGRGEERKGGYIFESQLLIIHQHTIVWEAGWPYHHIT